ncbi:putative Ig domain-containing protein [Saccharicrinis sp. FJH62]|uniref:putative Ig domain-containing protein n=1 Tax=Saccharicrinis sp. FJH62 TaxID=3344657 RepID=UPI0035D451A0
MRKSFLYRLLLIFLWITSNSYSQNKTTDFSIWKFKTGNHQTWQNPDFDDSEWSAIDVNKSWDVQGYQSYDGMGCYRSTIVIPSILGKIKNSEGLWFYLGAIDDRDSVFLNGKLIGSQSDWRNERKYFVDKNDTLIKWDQLNTIVVKVLDTGGGGGMYKGKPSIFPSSPVDFITIDNSQGGFYIDATGNVNRSIDIHSSSKNPVSGTLYITVKDLFEENIIYKTDKQVSLPSSGSIQYTLDFNREMNGPCRVNYQFTEEISQVSTSAFEDIPYILTPEAPLSPVINGPDITGVRPGNPFLYKIPATGKKPVTFSAKKLPKGLDLNKNTGIITGKIIKPGEYQVKLTAQNSYGKDVKDLCIKVGDTIALTPPMGWNSWNCWGLSLDEQKVKNAADAFIKTGLSEYGWTYINIDDGWEAPERDQYGHIHTNEKFSDMQALADYVHKNGLKIGLYSSPGPTTCGGYLGSYEHEQQDVETWVNWGFDYIKYDWCGYYTIYPNPTLDEMKKPYKLLSKILSNQPRDVVFSLCQYGMGDVWKWGGSVGGNLWRTTGDIEDTWESMSGIGFSQFDKAPYAKPGNWNDPDMLVVGKLGWGNVRNNRLTPDEQYTHISLWCLLKSPLLIGCDLTSLDDFTLNLLCNNEVLSINQDPLGKQAERIYNKDNIQMYKAELKGGRFAVGIFNLGGSTARITINPGILGLKESSILRDAWKQQDEGELNSDKIISVAPHGVKLYIIRQQD